MGYVFSLSGYGNQFTIISVHMIFHLSSFNLNADTPAVIRTPVARHGEIPNRIANGNCRVKGMTLHSPDEDDINYQYCTDTNVQDPGEASWKTRTRSYLYRGQT